MIDMEDNQHFGPLWDGRRPSRIAVGVRSELSR
jgi:hypothetical protein